MRTKRKVVKGIRQSRFGVLLSLFAMLLQFLLAAEHASAMAVAAAKGGSDGSPLGFLDICTAQGFVRIPAPSGALPNEPTKHSSGGETCAVCGTAATTGAASTPAAATVAVTTHTFLQAAHALPTQAQLPSAGLNPSEPTRAPPSF